MQEIIQWLSMQSLLQSSLEFWGKTFYSSYLKSGDIHLGFRINIKGNFVQGHVIMYQFHHICGYCKDIWNFSQSKSNWPSSHFEFGIARIITKNLKDPEMKIWIYWSESNSWIYFYIVLNKNWKIYWSEQSFTGLGPVLIVRTADSLMFYWTICK